MSIRAGQSGGRGDASGSVRESRGSAVREREEVLDSCFTVGNPCFRGGSLADSCFENGRPLRAHAGQEEDRRVPLRHFTRAAREMEKTRRGLNRCAELRREIEKKEGARN